MLRKLYESLSDMRQVEISYYKLIGDAKLKSSEIKFKAWKEYKKLNTSTKDIMNMLAEILYSKDGAQDENIILNKKSKNELIMDNIPDDVDLPEYLNDI